MIRKTTTFMLDADRYYFDFKFCSPSRGFAQIDTKQDASYYGNWCSISKRTLVSFAEGDVTITICDTDDEIVQVIREFIEWSDGGGNGPTLIDAGSHIVLEFVNAGLGDYLH